MKDTGMLTDRRTPGWHRLVRWLVLVLGILTLCLGLLAPEFRGQLLFSGGVLLLIGWFLQPLSRHYRTIAVVFLNTVLLLLVIEFLATATLATVNVRFVRDLLESVMGRPSKLVDHYLALPYYTDQEWSQQYWSELLQALRKDYYPYVIWRSPGFKGELLNIDAHGRRMTPDATCSPDALRVYVFGGSSTWGWGAPDWGTVPAYLQQQLSRQHAEPVCVVNYGENAFVSTQNVVQLLLLLDAGDVPDAVVFLDGVNDVLAASQNRVPLVHQNFEEIAALFEEPDPPLLTWVRDLHTVTLLQTLVRESGLAATAGSSAIGPGPDDLADAVARTYLNNYRIVSALAGSYGFRYYFFLQPYILAGDKVLTPEEQDMPTGLNWVFNLDATVVDLFADTYSRIEAGRPEHEHLYSLTGVFDEEPRQVWLDTWGHTTPVGNERIAAAISTVVDLR